MQEVAPDCLWVALSPTLRGRVHALDSAASLAEVRGFSARFGVGQPLRCTIAQVRACHRAHSMHRVMRLGGCVALC